MNKDQIQNLKLATTLANLAEIYKQKNDGTRSTIDLNVAARTVRDYPGNILDAYNRGYIKSLAGINEMTYKLIKEFLETGRIKLYDEIRGQYSDELIKFIRISGLGKRRIFKLYELFGSKSMSELYEKVHQSGIYKFILENTALDDEPINEIQTKRLIDSVDYCYSIKGLTPRGFLEFFVEDIINEFSRIKEVRKAVFTGSIRRKKLFVHDMDILLLPKFNSNEYDIEKSKLLLKEFCNLSFINELTEINPKPGSISGRFKTIFGLDMEIIITCSRSWPLDLFYTTGSKEHIKKIEELALQRGIFNKGSIQFKPGITASLEADSDALIYKTLDLQYIPPELRENNDEIELSLKGKLPKLITLGDIKGDLHVHSSWSDGLMDLNDMVEKAKTLGYEYLAISDHSISNRYGLGLDEERIIEKCKYIKDLKAKIKALKILMGGEVDIKSIGKMDYDENMLRLMDIVLGSMHSNYAYSLEENTLRVVSAIENSCVNIIAHPTGIVFGARAPYLIDMDRIIKTAAAYGKALEINSYYIRLDLNEDYSRKVKASGGRIAIDTDSHRLNNLDMIKLGVDVARRAGLEKEDVVNTMSLEELMNWKQETACNKK
jgi:DNA polymerase (family X)